LPLKLPNRYKHLATKLLAYEGDMTTTTNRPTVVLKNKGQVIESLVTISRKDSLQVWFKPIKTDSLAVSVKLKTLRILSSN
jgi:hypothetical protein